MLVYPQAQSLDISGPLEVFALASRQAQDDEPGRAPLYRMQVLAATDKPVELASGIRLLPDTHYRDMPDETDTLLVCGGMGDAVERVRADTNLVTWLHEAAQRVPRVASICSPFTRWYKGTCTNTYAEKRRETFQVSPGLR